MEAAEKQLQALVGRLPGIGAAALISREGVPLATVGMEEDLADTLAALASGMCALANRLSNNLANSAVRHLRVDLDGQDLVFAPTGSGAVLAVLRRGGTGEAGIAALRQEARGL
jgi:predicted regulator of Ras-like GTPase activity (Roadblock/LC7/MglB family)